MGSWERDLDLDLDDVWVGGLIKRGSLVSGGSVGPGRPLSCGGLVAPMRRREC
jgi:hypothetical protein